MADQESPVERVTRQIMKAIRGQETKPSAKCQSLDRTLERAAKSLREIVKRKKRANSMFPLRMQQTFPLTEERANDT